MHLSRRKLLAAGLGAICTGAAGAQEKPGQAKGTSAGKSNQFASDKMEMSLGGKNIKQWIAEISSPDPSRRENAIRTVPMIKGAEEAIPAILERVDRDPDSSPRVNAVMALGAIDFTNEADIKHAVHSLAVRATSDRQSIIRFQAALVLGRFGGKARPAMKELIQATKDLESWEIRKAAVFSLTRAATDMVEPVNPQAVEAITSRMYASVESSALVRLEATMSISTIGKITPADSIKVVKALRDAEKDKEKSLRIWARVGLCVHDNSLTPQDMKALVKFLQDPDLPARTHAARAIGTIAAAGNTADRMKEAVPALIDMLGDKEEHAQIAAIWALGQIKAPHAKPALKRLNEMLQDKAISDEGKGFIKEAIGMIEGKGKN
jgi:HEAT repeat protein